MKKAFIFLIGCMMLAGCTNTQKYANLSSGVIGCLPDEIEIEHESLIPIGGVSNWEASCKGKRYVCRYHSTTGVTCAPMYTPFLPKEKTADDSQQ